ncbi:FAD-binding oxidoreductase [Pseudooceanicola sp. HF7]|uniref:FAD-binding oxidoreductase n=1 Tax=Pseudooceanicola sp. HF7 TaxID=2721560 RepID=UPI0014309148|nr:FAD-binding oxidoreductase [Pseudooceanicola sp. HF7]NIZ11704.1 FAD-binding oxidoreductase [Pseudooceanicola sp. HF7]
MTRPLDTLLADLSDLPPAALLRDAGALARYAADATGNLSQPPLAVLRPATTAELSRMMAACARAALPIVIQGGLTGLSNGATPKAGEVAISLERMTRIEPVDPVSATLVAGAGATLQRVQEAAATAGLSFGVDIGARGSATIGGMAATNAGGLNVIRNGMMRAHVISLEVVLAGGRVLGHVRPLVKDNSGFDLKQIFIGSEGVLGVISRLCLSLRPAPGAQQTLFAAAPDMQAAAALLARLRRSAPGPVTAFEVMDEAIFARILAQGHRAPIEPKGIQILAEVETDAEAALHALLMGALEAGELSDVTLASSGFQAAALWTLREACAEAVGAMKSPVGFDIGLPVAAMPAFLAETRSALAALPQAEPAVFGHLGDGNLHYIVDTPDQKTVADIVFQAVARAGGAISAEHGLGREKPRYLPLVRSDDELLVMRGLKALLDPAGLLNSGRVLPPQS